METDILKKFAARDRHDLMNGVVEGELGVLIRTAKPLNSYERENLADAGFEQHFATGTVVSGSVSDPERLEAVAHLPFVDQIELSRPMFAERTTI